MQKLISAILGTILIFSAASALAGKQDRLALEQCKADLNVLYGDSTRVRLRSIKRDDEETDFRLMVKAGGGGNHVVICTVSSDGVSRLADQDGMALRPARDAQKVSMSR